MPETAAPQTGPATGPGASLDPDLFGNLDSPARIWAIGAIHATHAPLVALHDQLADRFRSGDRLVYLGNYMGRGPDTVAVMDTLLLFRRKLLSRAGMEAHDICYVRGAQEEMWAKLLKLQLAPDPATVLTWMLDHGVEPTLEAYGSTARDGLAHCREGTMALTRWTGRLRRAMQAHPGHFDLMMSLKRAARTSANSLLFVHASLDPSRPLAMQGDMFWWDTGRFQVIDRPYGDYQRVVRGYDHKKRQPELDNRYRATVDGGCGFGGSLHAICFDDAAKVVESITVPE